MIRDLVKAASEGKPNI